MSDSRPIGIFDSGVGGLTVVDKVRKILPGEDIIYFGDTARVPYGTKSKETITKFSVENVEFLMKHNVKIVLVACNTASSLSLDFLKRCFRVPIIGVIEPGARAAAGFTGNNKIGVIGTTATISSKAYEKAIKGIRPNARVFTQSCPLFVPLVEEGWTESPVADAIARVYLKSLKSNNVDTLIMGCTHYPMLKRVIQEVMGPRVFLIDSAVEVAKEALQLLDASGLLNERKAKGRCRYVVSDEPARFIKMGEKFLSQRIRCSRRSD